MRIYRYLLLLAPLAGIVFLTGAIRNPSAAPTEAPLLPDDLARLLDAPADGEAVAAVGRALTDLSDPARPWLQTGVKLRSLIPELLFRGEGTFARATGQRFRLEVRTRMDDPEMARAEATFFALSDGHDLWQATRNSKQEWCGVQRLRLGDIYRAADGPPRLAGVRARLLAGPGIRGPEQMLRSLVQNTAWVRVRAKGDDREVVGVWHPAVKAALLANYKCWPAALPRLYRLTLTGPEHWPSRLEWWGPSALDGPDRLLAEVEYAAPVRDRALTEEECARLFAFAPGEAKVEDRTDEVRAQVDPRP
jgi:hypothetical protein